MRSEPELKIGSIVIDCIDFNGMLAFWREALYYVTRNQAESGWVILRDPEERAPKRVTTNEIADRLGVPRTTYETHLRKAKGKVLRAIAPYLELKGTR